MIAVLFALSLSLQATPPEQKPSAAGIAARGHRPPAA